MWYVLNTSFDNSRTPTCTCTCTCKWFPACPNWRHILSLWCTCTCTCNPLLLFYQQTNKCAISLQNATIGYHMTPVEHNCFKQVCACYTSVHIMYMHVLLILSAHQKNQHDPLSLFSCQSSLSLARRRWMDTSHHHWSLSCTRTWHHVQ